MVLENIRSYGCGDDRDRIFATLGIAADGGIGDIVPDYGKSIEEIYMNVVKCKILASSESNCLSFLGYVVGRAPGSSISPTYEDLPTWAPDWRTKIACNTINKLREIDQPNRGNIFDASQNSKPDVKIEGRQLIAKGLAVDTVK